MEYPQQMQTKRSDAVHDAASNLTAAPLLWLIVCAFGLGHQNRAEEYVLNQ